jgi:phosphatidylserine/phosphatidylglycerophosphate/cardiolipin synthase-like enzyme
MVAKAIAYANNDVVQIGWSIDEKLAGCIGFAISRIPADADVPEVPLTSHIGFEEGDPKEWKAKRTTEQPIAGFRWRDLAPARGRAVRYKIVPLQGPAKAPQPVPHFKPLITPAVTATEIYGNVRAYFNRGILSTQNLSRALEAEGKSPSPAALRPHIEKAGDPIRLGLTGQLLSGLMSIIDRANKEGGKCYAALYELTDDELIEKLHSLRDVEIILSNNGTGKDGKPYDGGNAKAVSALRGKPIIRRYMPPGQIGHNKFIVYVGPDGEPKAVLTGSTNWTATGLCTQSNNCIIVESAELANQYLAYWHELKRDADQAGIPTQPEPMRDIQGDELREADAKPRPEISVAGGPDVQVWFSPNTPGLLKKTSDAPPDLGKLFEFCEKAEQAVMFLCFQPGSAGSEISTIVKFLSELSEKKPGLLIRGVISDQKEAEEFMQFRDPDEDADVIAPAGILDGFADWEKEFYKFGNAIVHDKIVVIDPFSPDKCVVVTGSHNLGYRASHNNDENMLILRGDRRIAQAYATHVFDIYSHYRWRYYMMQKAQRLANEAWQKAGGGKELKKKFPASAYFNQVVGWTHNEPDDKWQDRYFDPSSMASLERQFWVSEGEPLSGRVPKTAIEQRRGSILQPTGSESETPKRGRTARSGARKKPANGRRRSPAKTTRKGPAKKTSRRASSKRASPKKAPRRAVKRTTTTRKPRKVARARTSSRRARKTARKTRGRPKRR